MARRITFVRRSEFSLPQSRKPERQARCSCGKLQLSSKSQDGSLFGFVDRGADSSAARQDCKHCGYFDIAHEVVKREGRSGHPAFKCEGFEPHGVYEFDSFYCGHGGWD